MDATYGNIRHPIIAGTKKEFSFLYPSLYFFDHYSRKHGEKWDINTAGDFWSGKVAKARPSRAEPIGFKYLNKNLAFFLFSLAETINLSKDLLRRIAGPRAGRLSGSAARTALPTSLSASPRHRFADARCSVRSLLIFDRLLKLHILTFSELSVFAKLNSEVETAFSLKKFALVRSYASEVCKSRKRLDARNEPIARASVSTELTFARYVSLLFFKKQLSRAKSARRRLRYGEINFCSRRILDATKLVRKWEIISRVRAASSRSAGSKTDSVSFL